MSYSMQRESVGQSNGKAILRGLFEQYPDHCYVLTDDGTILKANDAALRETGAEPSSVVGHPFHPHIDEESEDIARRMLRDLKQGKPVRNVELCLQCKPTKRVSMLFNGNRLPCEGSPETMALLVGRDITRIRQRERRDTYLATHDALTGAYNRHCLNTVLQQELKRARRYGHCVGILMLDIDGLKLINDTHGHEQGDVALRYVARILRQSVRDCDWVIRYGGDEFLVLFPETGIEASQIARRIEQTFIRKGRHETGLMVPVAVSVGASHWNPDNERDIQDVINEADRRMYESRNA